MKNKVESIIQAFLDGQKIGNITVEPSSTGTRIILSESLKVTPEKLIQLVLDAECKIVINTFKGDVRNVMVQRIYDVPRCSK